MSRPAIFPVERLELRFRPKPWAFAADRHAEIDTFFAALRREKPDIWNGRVLLMHHQRVSGGVFQGDYLEADYASFAAWRAWGRPAAGVHDCFGAAAVATGDGAFLLGVMAPHTFNAGKIYFPCGTPDPEDIVGGAVDLEKSVRRELKEETGLDAGELMVESGWTVVADGSLVAQIKLLRSDDNAETMRARMLAHMKRETQPELCDIRIVHGPQDFDQAMPRFVTAYLTDHFKGRTS